MVSTGKKLLIFHVLKFQIFFINRCLFVDNVFSIHFSLMYPYFALRVRLTFLSFSRFCIWNKRKHFVDNSLGHWQHILLNLFFFKAININIPNKIANCITTLQLLQMLAGLILNFYSVYLISKNDYFISLLFLSIHTIINISSKCGIT